METLETLFLSFETGIRMAKAEKPREYLKSIGLDYNELRIGFKFRTISSQQRPRV